MADSLVEVVVLTAFHLIPALPRPFLQRESLGA